VVCVSDETGKGFGDEDVEDVAFGLGRVGEESRAVTVRKKRNWQRRHWDGVVAVNWRRRKSCDGFMTTEFVFRLGGWVQK